MRKFYKKAAILMAFVMVGSFSHTAYASTITELEDGTFNVKIIYTLLNKSITKEYKFNVENNALYLTDITDGTQTVYMAYTPAPPSTASSQSDVAA